MCLFLALFRAPILGYGWQAVTAPDPRVLKVFLGAYYDFLFAGVFTLLFLGLAAVFRNRVIPRRAVHVAFFIFALFVVLLGLANVKFVQVLGGPLNVRWLYYSGFLNGGNAALSSWVAISPALLLIGLVVAGGFFGLSLLFSRFSRRLSVRTQGYVAALACLLYFPVASWYLSSRQPWEPLKLENPTYSLLASAILEETPELFTMEARLPPDDVRRLDERTTPATGTATGSEMGAHLQNVLLVVMESLPAEYVELYGGTYPVTPVLEAYREQSLLFDSIYAPVPASAKALIALLHATYPWISYLTIVNEYPHAGLVSLSGELKQRGMRTAYFSSADERYLGVETYLRNHQFDRVDDYRSIPCDHAPGAAAKGDPDVGHDGCTSEAVIQWITREPEHPFFAVMWTGMTHYPYFAPGEEVDYGKAHMGSAWTAEHLNRYLNALHYGDQMLGRMLRMLEERGLAESTLVVVVGDHGEAFGRHGQYGHGSSIYEENVHVPLILINGRLFKGERNPTIGGLIDVAPTILDLLDMPIPGSWQGRSLFGPDRSPRTYFFSTWKEHSFGYREGHLKYIYNASRNTFELYDLSRDPLEQENLADEQLDREIVLERLASWVQYQNNLVGELRAAEALSRQDAVTQRP